MKNKNIGKWLTMVSMMCLVLSTSMAYAWSGYVNKDTSFNNSSYWQPLFPSYNDMNINFYYHDTTNSLIYINVVDVDGSDWSDVIGYQGKANHASGTWGTTLNYNPIFWRDTIASSQLNIQVCMKFDGMPSSRNEGIYYPWVSPYTHVAGAFVMLYFEFYYRDNSGNWHWSNINNPNAKDGIPDCFVFEIANRWYYDDVVTYQWQQAGSTGLAFNFFTAHTTHDDDLHDIRAGWQFTQDEINGHLWHTFSYNVQQRFSSWFAWFDNYCQNEGMSKGIANIQALRLVAVAVSVECYRAMYSMQFCDLWVYAKEGTSV